MELEGLKRCRTQLEEAEVSVESLTTDRHMQIQAYMRKFWSTTTHYYDTWHISKGKDQTYFVLFSPRLECLAFRLYFRQLA